MKPQLELTQCCESRSLDNLFHPHSATDSPLTHDQMLDPILLPSITLGTHCPWRGFQFDFW